VVAIGVANCMSLSALSPSDIILRFHVVLGLITATFMAVTVTSFIYPEHEIFSEIFVLPVTTLFAFTAVRANFPGAPSGFGSLTVLSKPIFTD
jgi:hypothetical protein